ncbi:MAG: FIST signal transduction protein [Phycisphaerales bacterium]
MSTATGSEIATTLYTRTGGWRDPLPDLDSERTLVLAFAGSGYFDDHARWDELTRMYRNSHLLGCSTAGEILGPRLHDDSIVLAVMRFRHTRLKTVWAPVRSSGASRDSGRALARQLDEPGLRGVLVLSDGLHVNGTELVGGLNETLPPGVIVTGGLAGDSASFERTWALRDGRPESRVVTAVGLYGDRVRIGHGSKGGWDVFGPERRVTRSEGNVLFELDGKPALALYKNYLGERAADLPASALLFPLALRSGPSDEKRLVRTVLSVDEDAQSMTFAGDVPEGHLAQLMRANFDRLIEGAADSAMMTRATHGEGSGLAIAISCVGRRLVLGERASEELERTLDVLSEGTQQVGFYSYGELSPYASGACDLHNQTMTLTTIEEA